MRVTVVETPLENNDERIDSDSDTLENIVEEGMVVAVLADDPNYRYYLQKLTTCPETIEQIFSYSWVALLIVVNNCKRNVLQEGTKLRSKTFLLKLIPGKTAACYSSAVCFICAELEKDKITVPVS